MNLVFVASGERAPAKSELERAEVEAAVLREADLSSAPSTQAFVRVDAGSTPDESACHDAQGEIARDEHGAIGCVHDAGAFATWEARVLGAARLPVAGVLLDGLDRWYLAGPREAGFCPSCAAKLDERLARTYGEMYVPSHPLAKLAVDEKAPFFRELAAQRWHGALETGARLVRRARDEGRRVRQAETLVGALFSGLSPPAVALATHLDLALVPAPAPAPERSRVATYELLLAALGRRELVGVIDRALAARPGAVVQAARLAAAAGASVALPSDAPEPSQVALAAHRRFWKELRTQYRPAERLAEVVVLYSPECDHWTGGRHGGGTRAAVEALTALGAQYRIVTTLPKAGSEPLVLADAGALPEVEAKAIERRVGEGAGVVVIGACGAVDDDGREVEGPFEPLQAGLNTSGGRTLFAIDPTGLAQGVAERRFEPLTPALERALESLVGRGRRAASFRGANLVVKCYLDPDRKLDVHLVGRSFDEATGAAALVKGATLHLSGAAASGARTGLLFTEDGQSRKLGLSPFGMGVQVALPEFAGSALFSISR